MENNAPQHTAEKLRRTLAGGLHMHILPGSSFEIMQTISFLYALLLAGISLRNFDFQKEENVPKRPKIHTETATDILCR